MYRTTKNRLISLLPLLAVLSLLFATVRAQSTQFTYQGRLTDGSLPANGAYDFQFKLFDALTGGNQVGATLSPTNVAVSAGVFTAPLDFGAGAFPGANRFLETSVRPAGNGAFTTLTPRQPVTSTPYAIKSLSAALADGLSASCNGCVTGSQISSLPAASGNYIQNTSAQQASSNFNISGVGKANVLEAATQFNLAGARVLSLGAVGSVFVGQQAGQSNTTGRENTFVGLSAGVVNTTGEFNTFVGGQAGDHNTTGQNNSFFGQNAGSQNKAGGFNTFIGTGAGVNNTDGQGNVFVGEGAGSSNSTGNDNVVIGHGAGVGTNNLTNAAAIGTFAQVTQSNSLVLGSIAGVNSASASAKVGIGTTAPGSLLTLKSGSATATALEINQGAIKVAGAGINTGTAVFIHEVTAGNIDPDLARTTVIDNPLTNGDVNAILIVTPVLRPGHGVVKQVFLDYNTGVGKWRMTHFDGTPMAVGENFNVMVVKP
jgi:hypothetical protein